MSLKNWHPELQAINVPDVDWSTEPRAALSKRHTLHICAHVHQGRRRVRTRLAYRPPLDAGFVVSPPHSF